MANIDDYNSLKPALEALPKEEINSPNMPVDTAIQEAKNTNYWGNIDRESLAPSGLDLSLIDSLLLRTRALQHCQSVWMQEYDATADVEKQWKELSTLAYALRDELIHFSRFAFRNNPELIKQVKRIAEGSGSADMIQDLNDLSLLGKAHLEDLTAVGLVATKLDTAETYAETLGVLLAEVNGVRAINNKPGKEMRDRAFTYLKQAVDTIRESGQFVFWKDEIKARNYASAYLRENRHRAKANADTAQ